MSGINSTDLLSIELYMEGQPRAACHKDPELICILEGQAVMELEGQKRTLQAGDLLLINSMKFHQVCLPENSSNSFLAASIKLSWNALIRSSRSSDILFWCDSANDLENANYDRLREVLQDLLTDYANNSVSNNLYRQSLSYKLMHILLHFFQVEQPEDPNKENTGYMEEILAFLETSYDQDVALADIAEYMALSPSYVSRYIKKQTGKNFIENLYEIRLRHAADALVESEAQITQIAADTGFPNIAAFNKHFKAAFQCTPSEYRKTQRAALKQDLAERRARIQEARSALQDHLWDKDRQCIENDGSASQITADLNQYSPYTPAWKQGINLGPAKALLSADVQQAVIYAKKHLGFCYGRFWSLFSPEMYTVSKDQPGSGRFSRLDHIISFLLENSIKPHIELGEKTNRIQRSEKDYVREDENSTLFENYDHFLNTLETMMRHLILTWSAEEVSTWMFEVWDDRRVEVYEDKQPYHILFRDVSNIIKKYAPSARIGGGGNYLGWFYDHTRDAVMQWIDHGLYPDFLSFNYLPYSLGEVQKERMSKRKSDEDDLANSIADLNRILKQTGFVKRPVWITDWNMTQSSRNYFNDSLWKACYIAKCCIEALGQVDALYVSQLFDSVNEYTDRQKLLVGGQGLLSRDLIEKPAFAALRFLRHLQKYLVAKGDGYVITRSDTGKITILLHNFIPRNYLYYLKEEYENQLEDHYTYFEHQKSRKFSIELSPVAENTTYELHHRIINRHSGSIIDEWEKLGFKEDLRLGDVEYLKRITAPAMRYTSAKSEQGRLCLDVTLEPLEVRCISITPIDF